MRSRLSNVLVGMVVVAMLGCDEGLRITDPVPSAVVDPAPATPDVRIRGPEAVQTPGEYEWHAWTSPDGTDQSYDWSVERLENGRWVARGTDRVLSLSLEERFQGTLRLRVVVTRGEKRMVAVTVVRACPERRDHHRCGDEL